MVDPIGLDFTSLNNITANFSINIPTDPAEILTSIPLDANINTGHWIAWILLFGLFVILYWVLAERTPFSDFAYSDAKALNIAFGICSIFGIVNIEINFYTNFKAVAFFITMFIITYIFTAIFENKE